MNGSLDRTSSNYSTDRSSFEIENPNKTTPLTGDKATNPTSTGFWSCFSGLSAGASSLRRGFAACCSSVARPIMSAYHFVVDKFYPDTVDYSPGQIDISDRRNVQHNIPEKGSFTAGTRVRRELGKEISAAAVDFLNKGDESLEQFFKDISRSTQFKLVDLNGDSKDIRYTPGADEQSNETQNDNALQALNEAVGSSPQGDYVTQAIASIANQTLGNTCNLLFANAPRPSRGGEERSMPFSTTKAAGFFSPSGKQANKEDAIINYTLEKKESSPGEEYFILKYENEAASKGYFEKNASDLTAPANLVLIDGERTPTMKTSMSLKITPNKNFDANKEITEENSPVHIECLDFESSYEFGSRSGEV